MEEKGNSKPTRYGSVAVSDSEAVSAVEDSKAENNMESRYVKSIK